MGDDFVSSIVACSNQSTMPDGRQWRTISIADTEKLAQQLNVPISAVELASLVGKLVTDEKPKEYWAELLPYSVEKIETQMKLSFKTVSALDTPAQMRKLIELYEYGVKDHKVPPLVLLAAFNSDFRNAKRQIVQQESE